MFEKVREFENQLATYWGSRFAVATDSCTHAIELCLRLTEPERVSCPTRTYVSVPFTFEKLNLDWEFQELGWANGYTIGGTNIIDAAPYWEESGYVAGSFTCLSFQSKKHLKLGRGGAILLDNEQAYKRLSRMVYDGRDILQPWRTNDIKEIGYHYYMTPETAQLGLAKFSGAVNTKPVEVTSDEYPYLPDLTVFQ